MRGWEEGGTPGKLTGMGTLPGEGEEGVDLQVFPPWASQLPWPQAHCSPLGAILTPPWAHHSPLGAHPHSTLGSPLTPGGPSSPHPGLTTQPEGHPPPPHHGKMRPHLEETPLNSTPDLKTAGRVQLGGLPLPPSPLTLSTGPGLRCPLRRQTSFRAPEEGRRGRALDPSWPGCPLASPPWGPPTTAAPPPGASLWGSGTPPPIRCFFLNSRPPSPCRLVPRKGAVG